MINAMQCSAEEWREGERVYRAMAKRYRRDAKRFEELAAVCERQARRREVIERGIVAAVDAFTFAGV